MKTICRGFVIFMALFLAVGAMAAKRYDINLSRPVQVSGTELKAGDYQIEVDGNSLVFYQKQKEVAKAPVRTEELPKKNEATSTITSQQKLVAVQLEGTKTKLLVEGQ